MITVRHMACCGLREITGLSNGDLPITQMKQFLKKVFAADGFSGGKYSRLMCSHVVFTEARHPRYDNGQPKYGHNFAAFIRANSLGTVSASRIGVNPNSNNQVKFWVWTIDGENLKKWALDNTK